MNVCIWKYLGAISRVFFFFDTRYFTIAVILIAQNTNSFFDYMLVRPYSFQCKFTNVPMNIFVNYFVNPKTLII